MNDDNFPSLRWTLWHDGDDAPFAAVNERGLAIHLLSTYDFVEDGETGERWYWDDYHGGWLPR